ncbi:hypothetical protein [Actinomadura sp. SCN-SB]|uniref:hypothetical protein n=1 Tax=Actinomadura sp. SCN-SB TaxID=3373092 RepID=UPI00375198D2
MPIELDESLRAIRTTLEADGFHLRAEESGDRLRVVITSDPDGCADCIVPEPVLQRILQDATGVPAEKIDVTYPADA